MKHSILLIFLFCASLGFAQDTGMVIGKVLDKDLNNEPLMFANISLKDSNIKSTSDISGVFLIEQLADGKHTVICSYPGYESKEVEVQIISGQPTEVEIILKARRLTLATASSSPSSNER